MRDERGVSPVIGTLLVLAMFMTVTGVVVTVGRPALIEFQEKGQFDAVSGQLGQVAGHMRQIAVAGTQYEVRQPRVAFPGGQLSADGGHWVAVTVSYFDIDYHEAHGDTSPEATMHRIQAVPFDNPTLTATDFRIGIILHDADYPLQTFRLGADAYRYDGGAWTCAACTGGFFLSDGVSGTPYPFVLGGLVSDGPWRVDIVERPIAGTDRLLGHVFLFQTPRLTYAFDAHAGPRYVHIENGATFREMDGQFTQISQGLLAAPNAAEGNTALTVRALDFEPMGISAGGKTKVGMLMRAEESHLFAYNTGGAWVNIQMWGPYPQVWYNHLEGAGFTPAVVPFAGVTYVQRNDAGDLVSFPFHFAYSVIDLNVRTT